MARWITVTRAFDYPWPGRNALTAFGEADVGEHFVKDELADYAIAKGHAREGKGEGSTTRSRKGKSPRRAKAATAATDNAEAADNGPSAPVGDADPADTDRSADREPVVDDAGER